MSKGHKHSFNPGQQRMSWDQNSMEQPGRCECGATAMRYRSVFSSSWGSWEVD